MSCGQNNSAQGALGAQMKDQKAIAAGSTQLNDKFSAFNPAFYDKYQQSYANQAMPSVMNAYTQGQQKTGFDLGNQGMLHGSVSQQAQAALAGNYNQGAQQAQMGGVQARQSLQSSIEAQRQQLLQQLQQSRSPSQQMQQILQLAAQTQTPSWATPLVNYFSNPMGGSGGGGGMGGGMSSMGSMGGGGAGGGGG
jgi:hypothetical protein